MSVDRGEAIPPRRPQDRTFVGNIVQAMLAYATGELGRDRDPAFGRRAHHRHRLRPHDGRRRAIAGKTCSRRYLRPDHVGIASINSPMQCMMKEVCAQCLQKHVDPETGSEEIVFSCFNQDQKMDESTSATSPRACARTPSRRS